MAEVSPAALKDGVEILEKYCRIKYGADISDRLQTANATLLVDDVTGSRDGARRGRLAGTGRKTTSLRQRLAAWRAPVRPCVDVVGERLGDGGRLLALTAIVCVYALVGGAVFHAIEGPNEVRHIQTENDKALARHLNYSLRLYEAARSNCTRDEDIEGCLRTIGPILRAYDLQTGLSTRLRPGVWGWNDYGNSIFYSMTIFTTIGYGHMYCRTKLGRVATIVYALFGIPLTLVLLHQLGQIIFERIEALWQTAVRFLRRSARRLQRRKQSAAKTGPRTERLPSATPLPFETAFPLPLALLIVFMYTFMCAGIFAIWEDEWDYFTGFYFFFISITTIGLGDEMSNHPRYALGFFLFFIVGLALLSMCVSVMYARIEARYMAALTLIDMQSSAASANEHLATTVAQPQLVVLLATPANGGDDLPTNGNHVTGGTSGATEAALVAAPIGAGVSSEGAPSKTVGQIETAVVAGRRTSADVEESAVQPAGDGDVGSSRLVVLSASALHGERAECPGAVLTADQAPCTNAGRRVLRSSTPTGSVISLQSYQQQQPRLVPQTVLGVLMASKRTLRRQQEQQQEQLLTTTSQSSADGNSDIALDETPAGQPKEASSGAPDTVVRSDTTPTPSASTKTTTERLFVLPETEEL